MKRLLTLVCVLCMVVALVPVSNHAASADITWRVSDGVLTLEGTGVMRDYKPGYSNPPWPKSNITKIIVAEGITRIGAYAFEDMRKFFYR